MKAGVALQRVPLTWGTVSKWQSKVLRNYTTTEWKHNAYPVLSICLSLRAQHSANLVKSGGWSDNAPHIAGALPIWRQNQTLWALLRVSHSQLDFFAGRAMQSWLTSYHQQRNSQTSGFAVSQAPTLFSLPGSSIRHAASEWKNNREGMSDKEQKELAELAPAQQTYASLMWGISCIWSVMIKRIKCMFYHTEWQE